MTPFLDPVREQEFIALARRRQRQADIQRSLKPVFEQIAHLHTPRNPVPKQYDAWSYPKRSMVYRMRGVRGCPECGGNGDVWVDLRGPGQSGDAYGFIRCTTCTQRLVSVKERA